MCGTSCHSRLTATFTQAASCLAGAASSSCVVLLNPGVSWCLPVINDKLFDAEVALPNVTHKLGLLA